MSEKSQSQKLIEALKEAGMEVTEHYLSFEEQAEWNRIGQETEAWFRQRDKEHEEMEEWLRKNPMYFKEAALV